ncbi:MULTISPECIES: DHHW family protein [unclassified Clostridium]|uniref:DHHW family protein n=1 Tax=unclassified Clostridium TaxID=2614128 RepID=UPI000297622A|nr:MULTISPECIES: DHHW family protein [unclassified Clostridium]EKQ51199.1 MAG: hypothetical protein A370_05069 [Clostridium sp. Maddingley MBC34-26]
MRRNRGTVLNIKIEKNKRVYKVVISLVFLMFIGGMALTNILKKDTLVSEQENRNLQQRPAFSVENLINGNFNKEYTSYISDQFPMRNMWIELKANLELAIGKKEINNVYLSKDNSLIEGFKEEPLEDTEEKADVLNKFASKYDKLNISLMLVPTTSEIYKEKLPDYAPVDDENKFISEFSSKLNQKIKLIDVSEKLKENKDEYIYYKTDHHWTSKGAYIAYNEMCKQLNIVPKEEKDFDIEDVTNNFYGSLYTKMAAGVGNPDTISIYFPKEKNDIVVNYPDEQKKVASLYSSAKLDEKDKYQVFTDGNHPLINVKSLGDSKKKLLIIKDSYANSFIPFLTPHYGEIDVVDLRYYMDDLNELIDVDEITDVLFLFNVNTFNEDKSILNLEG